jgi:hypothetical protein
MGLGQVVEITQGSKSISVVNIDCKQWILVGINKQG